MDLDEFVSSHAPQGNSAPFDLGNSELLDASLDGTLTAKAGTMVGDTGNVSFGRKSAGGLTGMLKSR